jgi:hypothetical protein
MPCYQYISGLYYNCVTMVIYDHKDCGLYYKHVINYSSISVPIAFSQGRVS